jgi:hypothetical protein
MPGRKQSKTETGVDVRRLTLETVVRPGFSPPGFSLGLSVPGFLQTGFVAIDNPVVALNMTRRSFF